MHSLHIFKVVVETWLLWKTSFSLCHYKHYKTSNLATNATNTCNRS